MSSIYANPTSIYLAAEATSIPRLKLVRMMYAGAIDSLERAKVKLDAKERPAFVKEVNKAQNIIAELNLALDFEAGGEISKRLDHLYEWMQRRLTPACLEGSKEPIDETIRVLKTLKEGWDGIRDEAEGALRQ